MTEEELKYASESEEKALSDYAMAWEDLANTDRE
jgi:hypothetical protein